MARIQNNQVQEDKENIFSEILYYYLPYWPIFLISFLICVITAALYLRYTNPKYEISAVILVKDEKKGVDDSNLMEQLDLFGSKKLVENEIEIIQSKTLMRSVIKNLNLYAPITYQGKITSRSGYTFSPVVVNVKHPEAIIGVEKIYFNYDSITKTIAINKNIYNLNQWIHNDSIGDYRFLPNINYRAPEKAKPLYFSAINLRVLTDDLLNDLKVSQATKLSSVIDIKYKDEVPKRGEDILNNLINEYNKAALADKNALASNTLKFVNERLYLIANELDSVENGIQEFKTKEGIFDISAQGQQYLESVGANDEKLAETSVQLAVIDQIEKYVRSKTDQPGIVPATLGIDNPVLTQLLGKLYDLEVQYEGYKKTTAENNPILLSLKNEIDKIKPSILENITNQRNNLESSKKDLSGNSSKYNSQLLAIPKKEKRLIEISRQQVIKNTIYSFLLQKREETALTYNSTIADTRIVDYAETTAKPVSPKKIITYIGSLLLATCLGVFFVACKEAFNRHIVFRSEIEKFTSVPIVGEISYTDTKNPLVIGDGNRTFVAEQFRQLRTSLAYIGINNKKKKILITSTLGSEGKSFITANLGLSLALMDKKVVLIELDLRKPKLSKLFGISRDVGISNYFIGNKEPDEIIKRTAANPNLFVISSGSIPPNPSELILNGRLEELFKYLENIFDYIIVDTAPVTPVTDAYILSPFCDATLYIIRHGVTLKQYIKFLDKNLQVRGLKNLSIVYNGVKTRGVTKYDYGYGYGQSASYGYMEENDKQSLFKRVFKKSKTIID